jgi:IS30 family transposase
MKNQKTPRTFRHITQGDRDRIQILHKKGHLQKDIARVLEVSTSALSREIKRGMTAEGYNTSVAQQKANKLRSKSKYCGMKIEQQPALRTHIIAELKNKRSPDEIAGRLKVDGKEMTISAKAIYRWLYSAFGQPYCQYLCTKRYRKKKTKGVEKKRSMIPNPLLLTERPKEGIHAQADLFVSPTKLNTSRSGFLAVLEDSKLCIGEMIENRSPTTMVPYMNSAVHSVGVNDVTLDRGIENKHHADFAVPAYFCNPYSPWEKPLVECSIGLLRRWFIPKKTDLRFVSNRTYQEYLHYLNHKQRRSLGYKSAYEFSLECGIIKKIPSLEEVLIDRQIAFQCII